MTGCKKEPEAPQQGVSAKKAAAPVQAAITTAKKEEYVYDPAGKRDPFKPFIELEKKTASAITKAPTTPLQTYELDELRLVGVIILPDKKVAMVEDPTGKGYSVREGTLIGRNDGRVLEISKDGFIVEEKYVDETAKIRTRRVSVKVSREQGGEDR